MEASDHGSGATFKEIAVMRHFATVALLLGSLAVSAAPAVGQTTSSTAKPAAAKPAKAASSTAEHSIKGVVKSLDASSLVLTSGKKDVTFVLNASTQREGQPAVGSTVSVRYHEESGSKIAMAVVAQPAKASTSATKSTSTTKK
jgi:hypothetical protein